MRILLTHRYIWPDTAPYALMLRRIGAHLAGEGHDVHVFGSRPSYRGGGHAPRSEEVDGMSVRRSFAFAEGGRNPAVRLANTALYAGAMARHVRALRPDVVTASTFPPVMAARAAARAGQEVGARFVYHMMDLHPEVSMLSGGRMGRGRLGRALMAADQINLAHAATAVVLSEDMKATLAARPDGLQCPVEVIANLALDSDSETPPPPELVKTPGQVRVIFAGNLGRFQDLPVLAEGVARLFPAHPDLKLMFLGDGVMRGKLAARWGAHPQVCFGPFLPFAQARPLIRDADLGLVSLAPGIHRVASPSKLQTYLGLGLPVLALVDEPSALAATVRAEGLGAVPDARTPEAIAAALAPFLADPDALRTARKKVRAYHARAGAAEAILAHWSALMARLAPGA